MITVKVPPLKNLYSNSTDNKYENLLHTKLTLLAWMISPYANVKLLVKKFKSLINTKYFQEIVTLYFLVIVSL